MRKSNFLSILIFVFSIAIDQFSKKWALGLASLHYNRGFIMGYYSDLPDSLRVISLASFSGFIVFLYFFLLFIIPNRASILKYGLSFLVGGIGGNVVDKIISGMTLDFIPFNLGDKRTFFNIADVFLWIGALLIVWFIFRREKLIWFPNSTRQNYLVRPKDQIRLAIYLTSIAFSSCLVLGLFSYTFFITILKSLHYERDHIMLTFFFAYSSLTLLISLLAFVTGIVLGHKTSGPLYAFELFVNDLLAGKNRKLKLRDGDSYQDLEVLAEKLRVHFKSDKE